MFLYAKESSWTGLKRVTYVSYVKSGQL